jgi:hypothetical protein
MSRAHHRGVTGARWARGRRIGLRPPGDGVRWGRHRRARRPSPVILQVTPPRLERVPLRAGRGEAHQAPVRGAGAPLGRGTPGHGATAWRVGAPPRARRERRWRRGVRRPSGSRGHRRVRVAVASVMTGQAWHRRCAPEGPRRAWPQQRLSRHNIPSKFILLLILAQDIADALFQAVEIPLPLIADNGAQQRVDLADGVQ